MTPEQAQDGMEVTGPYGEGVLVRQANGWDLVGGECVYQSIDLATHFPLDSKPPIVEIRSGDGIRVGQKERGKT